MTDSKFIYGIALLMAVVVGSFYYYSGKSRTLDLTGNNQMSASADGLQLIQTNERGQLALTANIAHITQWVAQDRSIAKQVNGTVYRNGTADLRFKAQQATAREQFRFIQLQQGVVFERSGNLEQAPLSIQTQSLNADTKTQQISTHDTVLLHTPQAQFQSQGLIANLQQSDYHFFKIRGLYEPIRP